MSCVMIPSVLPRSPVVRAALENGLPLPCAEHQGAQKVGMKQYTVLAISIHITLLLPDTQHTYFQGTSDSVMS